MALQSADVFFAHCGAIPTRAEQLAQGDVKLDPAYCKPGASKELEVSISQKKASSPESKERGEAEILRQLQELAQESSTQMPGEDLDIYDEEEDGIFDVDGDDDDKEQNGKKTLEEAIPAPQKHRRGSLDRYSSSKLRGLAEKDEQRKRRQSTDGTVYTRRSSRLLGEHQDITSSTRVVDCYPPDRKESVMSNLKSAAGTLNGTNLAISDDFWSSDSEIITSSNKKGFKKEADYVVFDLGSKKKLTEINLILPGTDMLGLSNPKCINVFYSVHESNGPWSKSRRAFIPEDSAAAQIAWRCEEPARYWKLVFGDETGVGGSGAPQNVSWGDRLRVHRIQLVVEGK